MTISESFFIMKGCYILFNKKLIIYFCVTLLAIEIILPIENIAYAVSSLPDTKLVERKLEEGHLLLHNEDNYEAAFECYNEAIRLSKGTRGYSHRGELLEFFYNVANDYFELHNYQSAIKYYSKIIESYPDADKQESIRREIAANNGGIVGIRTTTTSGCGSEVFIGTKCVFHLNQLDDSNTLILSYQKRGKCYQAIGDNTKAQMDFYNASKMIALENNTRPPTIEEAESYLNDHGLSLRDFGIDIYNN